MTAARRQGGAPFVTCIVALAAVAALGMLLDTALVRRLDQLAQDTALAIGSPGVVRVAYAVTVLGGITAMRALAAVAAVWSWRRAGWRPAVAMLASPWLSELVCDLAKRAWARPRPAGLGQGVDPTWSYPSAHAAVSAATCAMLAYACWREGMVPRAPALLAATLVPLLVGTSRVLLNVHWAADVIGGWGTGLAVASGIVAWYGRGRPAPPPWRGENVVVRASTP